MSNHYCRANLECAVLLYKQGLHDDGINILIDCFPEFEYEKRKIVDKFIRMEIEYQKKEEDSFTKIK